MIRSSAARNTLLGLILLGSAASAQGFFGVTLPPDYSTRFGAFTGVFDTANSLYGVRYLPLPLKYDIRLFFVTHPGYNEYGIYSHIVGTDILLGTFTGGADGIQTASIDHTPDQGFQSTTLLQTSPVPAETYLNYSQFGYAHRWAFFRLYGGVGYGSLGAVSAPYLNTVATTGNNFNVGKALKVPGLTLNVATTLRNWVYFTSGQQFTNVDLYAALSGPLNPHLNFSVTHLERHGLGNDVLSFAPGVLGFGPGPYRESHLNTIYKLYLPQQMPPALALRSVQFDGYVIWLDPANIGNQLKLGATGRVTVNSFLALEITPQYDFYFGLPSVKAALLYKPASGTSAFGPSLIYTYKPADSSWTGSVWQLGLVITDK
ncbi:hypothetical protein [Deinococcus rubellus]|uniref:Uncharacterized protein n=1 Tax=Deinococcus rubellus TaxID=1889240 RepID=A0ABY5YIB0_9DEIO|nr:hypothetical protein [Deinococcus rubellus]UWX63999.1 hypothetical protein N0D28_14970 [Deinococcus rubellus]